MKIYCATPSICSGQYSIPAVAPEKKVNPAGLSTNIGDKVVDNFGKKHAEAISSMHLNKLTNF